MDLEKFLTLFFSGGGVITLLTLYVTKRKNKDERKFDLIGRLTNEVDRLDDHVRELRALLNESENRLASTRHELTEEQQLNAKLNIVIIRLENTILDLKSQIAAMEKSGMTG